MVLRKVRDNRNVNPSAKMLIADRVILYSTLKTALLTACKLKPKICDNELFLNSAEIVEHGG